MTVLRDLQVEHGAIFGTGQGVQHFGDVAAEYQAAHESVVVIDRSDEGRLELLGEDRLTIVSRMSTNKVDVLTAGEGRATVLTTPIGRIIDRVILHQRSAERTLLRTGSGRAARIAAYLRANIFFRDKLSVADISADLAQLHLYGLGASAAAASLLDGAGVLGLHHVLEGDFKGSPLLAVGLDALGVPGIGLIVPAEHAPALWQLLVEYGARPAGLTTSEVLRVEAGVPGPEGELNEGYIPLEAGLWRDVSFNKGCYTGQEIIARMESRGKLAKVLVSVELNGPAAPGSAWSLNGRGQGALTSLAQRPDGAWLGLGYAHPDAAVVGNELELNEGYLATIIRVSGQDTV